MSESQEEKLYWFGVGLGVGAILVALFTIIASFIH